MQTGSIETIKHEADLWVRASGHPNVLPIIEANIYDEYIIIASEYAPDGSLEAYLKKYGKAPTIESAVEIISGILAGLEHLHSRSIIHRDLKPANILFQGDTPRLADFGISRVLKSTSQSSNIMGTPSYMAPEAFDGKRNEQTDIWSVGVIFYQLLAGRLPFQQEDITSLLGAILTRNPEPLPVIVPTHLQNIITRSLAKDTSIRYKSAAEMRKALRNPHETDPNFHSEKSVYTVQSPKNTLPPKTFHSPQTEKKNNTPHFIYAIAGLLAVVIIVISFVVMSHYNNSKMTENSAVELLTQKTNVKTSESTPLRSNDSSREAINNPSKIVRTNTTIETSTPRPTPFSRQITIPANQLWFDTGIDVTAKKVKIVYISGQWSNTNERGNVWASAEGIGIWDGLIVPTAPFLSLVGKTDNGTFQVGSRFEGKMGKGRLRLSMNDLPQHFDDNEGSLIVNITVLE